MKGHYLINSEFKGQVIASDAWTSGVSLQVLIIYTFFLLLSNETSQKDGGHR